MLAEAILSHATGAKYAEDDSLSRSCRPCVRQCLGIESQARAVPRRSPRAALSGALGLSGKVMLPLHLDQLGPDPDRRQGVTQPVGDGPDLFKVGWLLRRCSQPLLDAQEHGPKLLFIQLLEGPLVVAPGLIRRAGGLLGIFRCVGCGIIHARTVLADAPASIASRLCHGPDGATVPAAPRTGPGK